MDVAHLARSAQGDGFPNGADYGFHESAGQNARDPVNRGVPPGVGTSGVCLRETTVNRSTGEHNFVNDWASANTPQQQTARLAPLFSSLRARTHTCTQAQSYEMKGSLERCKRLTHPAVKSLQSNPTDHTRRMGKKPVNRHRSHRHYIRKSGNSLTCLNPRSFQVVSGRGRSLSRPGCILVKFRPR